MSTKPKVPKIFSCECPKCGKIATDTIDSRSDPVNKMRWRRRECKCGERFTTTEVSNFRLEEIVKELEELRGYKQQVKALLS